MKTGDIIVDRAFRELRRLRGMAERTADNPLLSHRVKRARVNALQREAIRLTYLILARSVSERAADHERAGTTDIEPGILAAEVRVKLLDRTGKPDQRDILLMRQGKL